MCGASRGIKHNSLTADISTASNFCAIDLTDLKLLEISSQVVEKAEKKYHLSQGISSILICLVIGTIYSAYLSLFCCQLSFGPYLFVGWKGSAGV